MQHVANMSLFICVYSVVKIKPLFLHTGVIISSKCVTKLGEPAPGEVEYNSAP